LSVAPLQFLLLVVSGEAKRAVAGDFVVVLHGALEKLYLLVERPRRSRSEGWHPDSEAERRLARSVLARARHGLSSRKSIALVMR